MKLQCRSDSMKSEMENIFIPSSFNSDISKNLHHSLPSGWMLFWCSELAHCCGIQVLFWTVQKSSYSSTYMDESFSKTWELKICLKCTQRPVPTDVKNQFLRLRWHKWINGWKSWRSSLFFSALNLIPCKN